MLFGKQAARMHARTMRGARGWWSVLGAVAAMVLVFGTAADAGSRSTSSIAGDLGSFEQGTVAVEGGTLHYVRGGSGPALVLLHGWPETWWEWREVMPDLARTHTVIAFDLPGLGQSSVPTDGYDAATVARRIHQGVTALGYHSVAIMAHDIGALIAYPYAKQFPDEVSRMAVLDLTLNGFGLEAAYGLDWHFLFNAARKPIPEKLIDSQDDVETYLGQLFDSAHHPEAIDRETYFRAYADPANRSAGYEYYRAFAADAAYNKANADPKLSMPVLAMGAQYVFGTQVADSFQNVAGDVRTVVAPDSGHWIPEENPGFLIDCASLFFGPSGQTAPPALTGCAP